MRKIFFIAIITIIIILGIKNVSSKTIPDEAIRIRIVANSNSEYDQIIKNKVKNNIQKELIYILKDTTNIVETRQAIQNNYDKLDNLIKETLEKEEYDLGYTINYGYNYFPEKEFNNEIYEAGEYESLLITLGKGEGDNWWCVLFPPLCIIEAEENDKVEYNSFFGELIKKLTK